MIGYDFTLPATKEVFQLRGTLQFRDYAGSFRYNVKEGSFMIFAKVGYGLSWYRLTEASVNDELLPDPDSDWIHKPTWLFGGGIEWVPFPHVDPPQFSSNISIRGDASIYGHSLGLDTNRCVFTLALTFTL